MPEWLVHAPALVAGRTVHYAKESLEVFLMIKSLRRLKDRIAGRMFGQGRSCPSPLSATSAPGPEGNPLTAVRQIVQTALPLLEEQLGAIRRMDEHFADIEEQLGRAWREREGLVDDYYAMLRNVLQVLDDCRAMGDTGPELKVIGAGLEKLLQQQGVKAIEVAVGDRFQSDRHLCEQTDASGEKPPGTVLRVVEPGYLRQLNDGSTVTIRPARVVVSQTQSSSEEFHE